MPRTIVVDKNGKHIMYADDRIDKTVGQVVPAKSDRIELLSNLIAASSPGGIEEQERNGQIIQENKQTLPLKMPERDKQLLESLGFVFGAPVDTLFYGVTFPKGWSKKATSHSMWSDLLDPQGRKRGSIFYKAAFYDQDAHMNLRCRYHAERHIGCDAEGNDVSRDDGRPSHFKVVIKDHDDSIVHIVGIRADRDWEAADRLEEQATAWLNENKPDHNDPSAYWD